MEHEKIKFYKDKICEITFAHVIKQRSLRLKNMVIKI